ncbi:MAG: 23S rRNA (uracil(1939)-C(5))-methyltransferase RlmD [Candidatus Aminicenantes bacterium]|nr:23S rRNA (uracil(1939)-C(5))-methyltransferase RlmD [Candidatus Aminicenantes bacterium]
MANVFISKIVYPGKSLGYFEGKAIFTNEGLPGEIVEVELKKIKKDYIEGVTRRIVTPSPRRINPRCSHYWVCSPYQVMEYEYQLEIKQQQIKEIFYRQLGLDLPFLEIIPSPLIWGYRNRAHFHLIWSDEVPSLAYHQPGYLEEFVSVDNCFLLPEKANSILSQARQIIQTAKLKEIKEIEVRFSFSSEEIMLVLLVDEKGAPHLSPLNDQKNIAGSICSSPKKGKVREEDVGPAIRNNWTNLQKIFCSSPLSGSVVILRKRGKQREQLFFGPNLIWEEIQGIRYALGPQSFFQVNILLLARLIKDLKEIIPLSGKERLADLYCGVGTFGLALASQVATVFGVELMPENIALLKKNLEINQINNFNLAAGLASKLAESVLSQGLEVIIVNPPRGGLEKKVIKALNSYPARLLLYLSCNPTTLARDVSNLLHVYKLKSLRFYDFFPHTPHIEILAVFERK